MLSWKYTAPAFLVPLAFTIDPRGLGLLLQASAADVAWSAITATLGVIAIAAAAGGWIRRRASVAERIAAGAAALLLFVPALRVAGAGAALLAIVVAVHWRRTA
jgi:TRAP-type uncharacterized transport system fused permease subunit